MNAYFRAMLSFRKFWRGETPPKDVFHRHAIPPQDGPDQFQLPECGALNLFEVTVDELQRLMSSNQLTAETYVTFCLQRIRQVNLLCWRLEVAL